MSLQYWISLVYVALLMTIGSALYAGIEQVMQ